MKYEHRLIAAAKSVFVADSQAGDGAVNPTDIGVKATLKPHQVEGITWLIRRYHMGVNVILDGTGENPASYFFVELFESLSDVTWTIFVVLYAVILCPLSVTDGWVSEVATFAPKLRVLCYVGDKDHRRSLRKKMYEHVIEQPSMPDVVLLPFDALLTTYDIALMDQDFLSQIPWQYAIIDEAQRLKNPSSVLYNVLRERFIMPRRLLMTGTPIQNNLTELWALMHFCMPSIFGTHEQFLATFEEAGDCLS
ncbi:DNA helicase, partial [Sarracenia purpurea var. burkii]